MVRRELGIHQGKHYKHKDHPESTLFTLRSFDNRGQVYIDSIIIDPSALPFRDVKSEEGPLITVNPPRGIVGIPELKRVSEVVFANASPSFSEHLPIIGRGVKSFRRITQDHGESDRWILDEVQTQIAQGKHKTSGSATREANNMLGRDPRWIRRDTEVLALQTAIIYSIGGPNISSMLLKGNDISQIGLAVVALHAIVREPYLLIRAPMEIRGILKRHERTRMKALRIAAAIPSYILVAGLNLLPGFAYFTTPLYSLPRNLGGIGKYMKTEGRKGLNKIDDKILQLHDSLSRRFLHKPVDRRNIYGKNREPALGELAEKKRIETKDAKVLIVTAANIGHPEIDERVLTASRAHYADAIDVFRAFKDKENMLI